MKQRIFRDLYSKQYILTQKNGQALDKGWKNVVQCDKLETLKQFLKDKA